MADEIGNAFKRCGNCEHRRIVDPKDLTSGVCFEGPPQNVVLPARGGVVMQSMRPPVAPNDPHCGHWQLKVSATQAKVADELRNLDLSGKRQN